MASVMVTTFNKDNYGTFFQGICGNTEAFVTHSHGTVRVCVVNSSHKAFRIGAGKIGNHTDGYGTRFALIFNRRRK